MAVAWPSTCTYFVPFCAHAKMSKPCKCLKGMAGTTGLEAAVSAVTAQLRTTRGLPKYLQVVQDIIFCGLDCGLEKQRPWPLPSPGSGQRWVALRCKEITRR